MQTECEKFTPSLPTTPKWLKKNKENSYLCYLTQGTMIAWNYNFTSRQEVLKYLYQLSVLYQFKHFIAYLPSYKSIRFHNS